MSYQIILIICTFVICQTVYGTNHKILWCLCRDPVKVKNDGWMIDASVALVGKCVMCRLYQPPSKVLCEAKLCQKVHSSASPWLCQCSPAAIQSAGRQQVPMPPSPFQPVSAVHRADPLSPEAPLADPELALTSSATPPSLCSVGPTSLSHHLPLCEWLGPHSGHAPQGWYLKVGKNNHENVVSIAEIEHMTLSSCTTISALNQRYLLIFIISIYLYKNNMVINKIWFHSRLGLNCVIIWLYIIDWLMPTKTNP